jgi:hypothetical protein
MAEFRSPGDAAPDAGWLIRQLAGIAGLAAFIFGTVPRAMRNQPSE